MPKAVLKVFSFKLIENSVIQMRYKLSEDFFDFKVLTIKKKIWYYYFIILNYSGNRLGNARPSEENALITC